jgi:hypothetical protein
MPVHDWTRVNAGIFHDFHLGWLAELRKILNGGLLPPNYYALAEQLAGGLGPDVITLQQPANDLLPSTEPQGGIALATIPPQVQFRARAETDLYAARAKTLTIRHASNHRVVAMIEIVSPGNKNNRHGFRTCLEKSVEVLRAGVHLLIVDLFPPGPRDPQGLHKAIWDQITDNDFCLPADKPLSLAAYTGGPFPEYFVEPTGVGMVLKEMPLFLTPEHYQLVPLEATYLAAWGAVPTFWRSVLEKVAD